MKGEPWGVHGGTSTGSRTAEGLERLRQARTIHGGRSAEMIAPRRERAAWARLRRATTKAVE